MVKYWYFGQDEILSEEFDNNVTNTGRKSGCQLPIEIHTFTFKDIEEFQDRLEVMVYHVQSRVIKKEITSAKVNYFGEFYPFQNANQIQISYSANPEKAYIYAHYGELKFA